MSEPKPQPEAGRSIRDADASFPDCDANAVESCPYSGKSAQAAPLQRKDPASRPCVTQIKATIRGTQGLRSKNDKRPDRALRPSGSSDKSLKGNAPVILVRGCKEVMLEAVTKPPNSPVTWKVEPNETTNQPPAIAGSGTKATLKTNVDGSFAVIASAGGCKVVWNVVFVWVKVDVASSAIIKRKDTYDDDTMFAGDGGKYSLGKLTRFKSGDFKKGLYPWEARVRVELVGGGANKQLGLNKVGLHVLQNGVAENTTAHYAKKGTAQKQIDVSFPLLDSSGQDSAFITIDMFEVTPFSMTEFEVFAGDAPTGVYPFNHEVTHEQLQSISGGTFFRSAIASTSEDAPDTITVHADTKWSVDYLGIVDKNAKYVPKGAHTNADKEFALIADATGGTDAELAGFETFGPRFLDFQDKAWVPATK